MNHRYTRYALCAALLFLTLPSQAQDSPQLQACNQKAVTQIDMNACAGQEADRVDAKLNAAYRQLLAKAAGEQNAVGKIKSAERAWIAYRDAFIEARYPASDKRAEYGSIYGMDVALLRARLTQQHLQDIQELLKAYSDGDAAQKR